jgi:murein tripeptide amidase MpaA
MENMHLHILPTMNPDGFALRRRGNANNVDLNGDFPDQVSDALFSSYGIFPFVLYLLEPFN